jgi:hypothetical protein
MTRGIQLHRSHSLPETSHPEDAYRGFHLTERITFVQLSAQSLNLELNLEFNLELLERQGGRWAYLLNDLCKVFEGLSMLILLVVAQSNAVE